MSDLISRADAIEAINRQWLHGVNVPICEEIRTAIVQIISALPSAEADVYEDYEHATLVDIKEPLNASAEADSDGKLFKYKLKGGIVQSYEVVPSSEAVQGEWIPCDGKLPNTVGDHVLVTIKWADDDLEVCEMCPASASRYNIVAYQNMPTPYKGWGDDE